MARMLRIVKKRYGQKLSNPISGKTMATMNSIDFDVEDFFI